MTVEISDLLRMDPITVPADATIQHTAQIMSDNNVSSVMVMDGGNLAGVITDRDLRRRCVAVGRSGDEPASAIMTPNPETIQSNSLMVHALMTMTRLHVHHLPVMKGEDLVGMITATDLARHQSTNSAYMAVDIRKAKSVEDLIKASQRLPSLQMQLSSASATALHIGEAISCITDSITARLLEMAEEKLGKPPVSYVWMAGGSQARYEQSSHSDQDNALLISDDMTAEDEPYFEALAKFVNDGLNACGFVYCPGDAMASNPKWRQPLRVWKQYFASWIEKPEPMALMLSSIFFDLRPVRGNRGLFEQLQREVLNRTRENRIFIAYMAANALQHSPPLGFFRTFVLISGGEHDDTFDIKHRGIVPITDVARVYALSEGLRPVNTTERLRAAVESGAMSREMGENLEDALEFIASLRIRHQADQIRLGEKADNYLPPDDLSVFERDHLKDAFKVIQSIQSTLDSRYQASRLR
jgi:CBS domain-containing protein